jgi:hypothetical protein
MPVYPDDPQQFTHHLRAEFVNDPAVGLGPGDTLTFEAGLIKSEPGVGRSTWVKNWPVFDGLLLSVNFASAQGYDAEGSAVLVAPGLALCAHHVIAPHYSALQARTAASVCVALARPDLHLWRVVRTTWVGGTDLELLSLARASALPADRRFAQATISTRTPKLGEWLTLHGLRRERMEVRPNEIGCYGNVLACQGQVTNVYPSMRDRTMLPWPVVEVDCPAWGAMSGGPVFDEGGFLIGLVCSSFGGEAGGEGPAYVSLLWPALGHPVLQKWPTWHASGTETCLHDLTTCLIEGREAFSRTRRDDGAVLWQISHW